MAGPVEREQRRAVTRRQTHPVPAGLLPAAAADGKLLHGSVTADARTFLVAAIDHTTGRVLGQRQVADKRGESTTIEPLLSGLPAGIVWTLDAPRPTRSRRSLRRPRHLENRH
jgi:hypothetical protein